MTFETNGGDGENICGIGKRLDFNYITASKFILKRKVVKPRRRKFNT
jgi:hypothetical protein